MEGLLKAQRYGWEQAHRVLALLALYRTEDLTAALERAIRYRAFSANSVERILAAQAQPKPASESWSEEERKQLHEMFGDAPEPGRPTSGDPSPLPEEENHEPATNHEEGSAPGGTNGAEDQPTNSNDPDSQDDDDGSSAPA